MPYFGVFGNNFQNLLSNQTLQEDKFESADFKYEFEISSLKFVVLQSLM